VLVQTACGEDYWPGWLGPNRDGWVSEFQTPQKWPAKLKPVWRVEVGTGYGTPLVVDDKVFQHARQGDEEIVWCVDFKTGEVDWKNSSPVQFKIGGGGERHGKGPKSCPVYSDGRLFTMSITGELTARDTLTGKVLWRRNYDKQFKKSHPYWGAATSPIVDGDRVIVHFGTDAAGALVALNVKNGDEVWSQGNDGASYSSPLLVELNGVRQVVEWNHNSLVGVESKTGKLLWKHPFPHVGHNQNMPTPTVHNGRVLLGGENRGIYSLEPQLENGQWSVTEKWFQKDVALDMSSAVINGDLLFGFSHYGSGRLFCLDTETGKILWQGPGRVGRNVAFLSVRGYVVALLDNGQLQINTASGERLETVANYPVADGEAWAPPVLLQNGFLVKDLKVLTRWTFD